FIPQIGDHRFADLQRTKADVGLGTLVLLGNRRGRHAPRLLGHAGTHRESGEQGHEDGTPALKCENTSHAGTPSRMVTSDPMRSYTGERANARGARCARLSA